MPTSQQFDPVIVFNFAVSSLLITGVAVMTSRAMGSSARTELTRLPHSIPLEAKKPLVEKYGKWAVNRAEGMCPHNDVACVEREAKWSLKVYRQRREI